MDSPRTFSPSNEKEEFLSWIAPQSRLEFLTDQKPQSLLYHTLHYIEIPQSRHWICDTCLDKHINKAFDCYVGYRHAAVANTSFLPSLCAICYAFMDIYSIYFACKECTLFYNDYFINLPTEKFIKVYNDNATIVKRWIDCKFYKIVNPL